VTGEQRGLAVAGGAEGKVLGVRRPRGLRGKGRPGAPAAGKARRGSSYGSGARGSTAMGAHVERGGMGGPTVGKGWCESSYGGRGTGGVEPPCGGGARVQPRERIGREMEMCAVCREGNERPASSPTLRKNSRLALCPYDK
jgi:hypothetical protein